MDIIRVIMCEGVYHGLYKLENRGEQYYWSYIPLSNPIYKETYPQLNVERSRGGYTFNEIKYIGNLILFKEEDLGDST